MKQVWVRSRRVIGLVRAVWSLLVAFGAVAVHGQAAASPAYGYALINEGYSRGCAACHDDTATTGGAGTANKPFAKTMKGLGLTGGGNYAVFIDILNTKIEDHDTDCDGVIDLDELTNDGDVNDAAVVPEGFVAMPVANCNGDADTTSSSDSTSDVGATSGASDDAFEDSSEGESGCTVAARSSNGGWSAVAGYVAVIGIVWVRRRASTRRVSLIS